MIGRLAHGDAGEGAERLLGLNLDTYLDVGLHALGSGTARVPIWKLFETVKLKV